SNDLLSDRRVTIAGMDQPQNQHRNLFAVWRWSWWVWAIVVPLTAVIYFLSAAPVYLVAMELELSDRIPTGSAETVAICYFPAWTITDRGAARVVRDWEWSVTEQAINSFKN